MLSSKARKLERDFQSNDLIPRLRKEFPGCIILKNDTRYRQGIPDLTLFYQDRWAWLEVKSHIDAEYEPNQEYYLAQAHQMSFGRMICPENMEAVITELLEEWSTF